MNIIGVMALQELKKFKGFEEAVIAGGAVRDYMLGEEPTDIDIFVPVNSESEFISFVRDQLKDSKFIGEEQRETYINPIDFKLKERSLLKYEKSKYLEGDELFIGKFDLKFAGIDVDLCAYHFAPRAKDFAGNLTGEPFGDFLVSRFNFDISKCWYDGSLHIDPAAQRDFDNHTITLSKINSIDQLPYAMKKFSSIQSKYPDYTFKSPRITIVREEEKVVDKYKKMTEYANAYGMASGRVVPGTLRRGLTLPDAPAVTRGNVALGDNAGWNNWVEDAFPAVNQLDAPAVTRAGTVFRGETEPGWGLNQATAANQLNIPTHDEFVRMVQAEENIDPVEMLGVDDRAAHEGDTFQGTAEQTLHAQQANGFVNWMRNVRIRDNNGG